MARPTIKPDNIDELVTEYLDKCKESQKTEDPELPTDQGLILHLGVSTASFYGWKAKDPKFLESVERVKLIQGKQLINGSIYNKLNPTISKLLLHNHGFTEKQEIDNTHSFPDEIKVTFLKTDKK